MKKVKNLGLGVIKFIGNGLLWRLGNQSRASPLHVSEEIAVKGEVILSLKRCLSTHLFSSLHVKQMWRTMETVTESIFLDFKITVDGDCHHEIKRCLLLGRKAMISLDRGQTQTEGRRQRGHRGRGLEGITDSTDMSFSKLLEMVKNREAWHAAVHGVIKNQTQLSE